jgi:hypothetical protein
MIFSDLDRVSLDPTNERDADLLPGGSIPVALGRNHCNVQIVRIISCHAQRCKRPRLSHHLGVFITAQVLPKSVACRLPSALPGGGFARCRPLLVGLRTGANVEIRDSATPPAMKLGVLAGLRAEPCSLKDAMRSLAEELLCGCRRAACQEPGRRFTLEVLAFLRA